nr:hypothetical protein Iba_chr12fCG15270 [Ipomoea batatas]
MAMTKNSGPIQLWLQIKEHNSITKIGSEEALYEPSVRENPGNSQAPCGTTIKKGADVAKQGVKRPGELPIGYQTFKHQASSATDDSSSLSSRPAEGLHSETEAKGWENREGEELTKIWEKETVKPPPLLKLVAVVGSAVPPARRRRRMGMSED